MKNSIYFIFFLIVFTNFDLSAQSELLGKWQSNIEHEGADRMILEYNFINNSEMSMSFYMDNIIPKEGRCISKVSWDGKYIVSGPIFFISLNEESLNVSILKFESIYGNPSTHEQQIIELLKSSALNLFNGFKEIETFYVSHDDKDTISFISGNESHAKEIEFHRPTESIVTLFDKDKERKMNIDVNSKLDEIDKRYHSFDSSILMMLKSLLLFILFLFLSIAIISGVKYFIIKIISRTNNAKESVIYRRIYFVVRFVLRIILIIIGLLLLFFCLSKAIEVNNYIGIAVFFGGGSLLLYLMSSLSLPMNFMTMEKFTSKEQNFILYLRGFISDDYTPGMEAKAEAFKEATPWFINIDNEKAKKNPNLFPLNEKCLSKACKKYAQIISVGLPEELESPEGCKRIYLDNESWQEDVKSLMKLAKFIFVCIHPNDNCIWEIKQCNSHFSDKTIYFVDNLDKLKFVREKLGEDIPECLKLGTVYRNHMIAYMKNGEVILDSYINTEYGLAETLNVFLLTDKRDIEIK